MQMPTYMVPATERSEVKLKIEVTPQREYGLTSAYRFMKQYPLHGETTLGDLLFLIAKHQLGEAIEVSEEVWDDLVAIKATFTVKKNGANVDDIESDKVSTYYAGPTIDPGRLLGIGGYAKEMDHSWPKPIFVHSSVLSKFGFAVASDIAFVLNGSKRIIAGSMSQKSFSEAHLITTSEYSGAALIEPGIADAGKLIWFPGYQKVPEAGISGWRDTTRYRYIDMSGVRDKIVIDFGCNIGQTCIKMAIAGAEHVYGLDCQADTLEVANRIISELGLSNISYHEVNFNDADFEQQIDGIVETEADVSFFLSVYRTGDLVQRDKLFEYIIAKTRGEVFFEGHASPEIDTLEYYAELFGRFGLNYEFKGYSEGSTRPFYILTS